LRGTMNAICGMEALRFRFDPIVWCARGKGFTGLAREEVPRWDGMGVMGLRIDTCDALCRKTAFWNMQRRPVVQTVGIPLVQPLMPRD
jgi:hypothetical protein